MAAVPARAGDAWRVDGGAVVEDYSFSAAGVTQWAQVLARPQRWRGWGLSAGESVVRRFGFTDAQGSLGLSGRPAPATGIEARLSLSPAAAVLPQVGLETFVYQRAGPGLTLTPGYRFGRYTVADVHALSLGGEWEAGRLSFLVRPYVVVSAFRQGGPTVGHEAAIGQVRLDAGGGWSLAPSYAWREEAFQAGAPGSFTAGSFTAHTGRVEVRRSFGDAGSFQGAWSYEERSPSATLRQYEAGLTARF